MQAHSYDDKTIPLHDGPQYPEIHTSAHQDIPDGMKPAMAAVALMTLTMVFLLCKGEFISTTE